MCLEKLKIALKEEKLRKLEEDLNLDELDLEEDELNSLLLEYLSNRRESQEAFCKRRDERFRIMRLRREARKKVI